MNKKYLLEHIQKTEIRDIILIYNFPGGNSGENIELSSTNAITTMARILKDKDILLKSINGGTFENELEEISDKSKGLNNNFQVNEIYRDSVWKINTESNLLNKYKDLYFSEFNEYPKEEVGHGGTECSSIKKRIDELDIISIGANMEKIHTIEETTYISSWLKTYHILINLLKNI